MEIAVVLLIAALVMSVVFHEVAHGWMADYLGDPTARYEGRLTLNPINHVDPFGSVLLPAILVLTSSPILIGWAKPVPYNPYNLKKGGRWAEMLVAAAGPGANIAIALGLALVLRLGIGIEAADFLFSVVTMNVMLALFNLVPIPPLDGSKILAALLPEPFAQSYERLRTQLEWNPFLGFGLVIVFVMVFGSVLSTLVFSLSRALLGV